MPKIALEDSDFDSIIELLRSFTPRQVAEKYDVVVQSVNRFLVRHHTSTREIINAHRTNIIKQANQDKEPVEITAERMGVAINHFYSMRVKLLGKDWRYWKPNCY